MRQAKRKVMKKRYFKHSGLGISLRNLQWVIRRLSTHIPNHF
jgi:hypothetical protein